MYPWHETLWQRFCQQQQQNKLPHALLLSGAAGLGKNTFASSIVANVLCSSLNKDYSPCGQCHSCQLLKAGNHPDHIEINPEETGKQIKVDQIRELKEKQNLTSSVAKWKTIVISPADSMNVNASNSLLKLIEEPQDNTLLLLISDKPEKLPITIRSRCQIFHFTIPATSQSLAWLRSQKPDLNSSKLENLLQLAHGAPIKVLELIANNTSEQFQQIEDEFNTLMNCQVNAVILSTSWKNFELEQLLHYLQALIQHRLIEIMKNRSQTMMNDYYFKISDCIINTLKLLSSSNNINKTLLLEEFIVSVLQILQTKNKS